MDTTRLYNEAVTLHAAGQLDRAEALYRSLLTADPRHVNAAFNRGLALQGLQRPDEALASYEQVIALQPDHWHAYHARGTVLAGLRRYRKALESYDRALSLRPEHATVHVDRGGALFNLERYAEALASYERALALTPEDPRAHNLRGNTLFEMARYSEALESYERALALKSEYAQAQVNRGITLRELRRYAEALESYDRAIDLKPELAEAHWNKGLLRLLLGEFEEGWKLYEWRWKTQDSAPLVRHFHQPLWLGVEPLQGRTILLHAEQGLGDTIQFSRYVPRVEALGARVTVEVHPALRTLMGSLSPTATVVAQGQALPQFDYHCPILSLPLAFQTTLATVPAQVPYLHADPARVSRWQARLGPKTGPRVGLAWSGRRGHLHGQDRSMPLQSLRPLFASRCEFHCVQKEIRPEDVPILVNQPVRVHAGDLQDFADTAALISALDLVITVDTAVAHLAGALGLPVWILLPYTRDFRWLIDREDSPWYPTARLFRQGAVGDWDSVIAAARTELETFLPCP